MPVTVAMARATRWLRSGIVAADPLGSESADAAANCGNTTQKAAIGVQVGITRLTRTAMQLAYFSFFAGLYPALTASCSVMNLLCLVVSYHWPLL